MSQKLPVNNFEWMEDNEDFIKIYNEESCEGYFLKVDLHYTEEVEKLVANIHYKLNMLYT